ncbi:MAG: HEAT repeat domain-containing protein [Bradymonadia bacterium]
MKRRLITVALATSLLALGGCGQKSDTPKKDTKTGETAQKAASDKAKAAGDKATEVAKTAGDAAKAGAEKAAGDVAKGAQGALEAAADAKKTAAAMLKPGEAPTPEQFEALLLGLTACEVTERDIDRKCDAWKAYDAARKAGRKAAMKNLGGLYASLGKKHISHEHPAVRLQSASMMSSIFGASEDSQQALVAAAKAEKDARVLRAMIRAMGSSVGKNEGVRALLLETAQHADEKVRIEVVSWLTSSWAQGTEGTLEKAMDIVKSDTSEDVRRFACKRLGERGDERALPLLKKMTDAKQAENLKDPRMFASCFEGIIAMWSAPVPHKAPSKAAYTHTLALLKDKAHRDEKNPPWTVFSRLRWAKKPKFQEAAPWYKAADVHKVLNDIIVDRKTNWMARTGAVDTLKDLGGDKKVFEKLKKSYKGAEKQDAHVLKKIEKALSSL